MVDLLAFDQITVFQEKIFFFMALIIGNQLEINCQFLYL